MIVEEYSKVKKWERLKDEIGFAGTDICICG
ncbi:hypothetical protein EDC14_102157 [Hydrogenispora ethanolica]|jgi:hypothetical protein|uniref:Uncharacterized protein n=1 Tax=Hydrogenispora ethanolica TaxID=1082276 RepID=A0A4R1RC66_HYDET|nr:hypothetical protein EDC14_102157 [Hydrogenispora ethanolica]